jgi:hypothetical protein
LLGALAVGGLLGLLMGYIALLIVMGEADHYGLPIMVVVACLALVLGVGVVMGGHDDRGEKP